MLETGTILNGRYEIVRLIAEGGMGAVYEGRDMKFGGGPVAIKRCLMTGEAMQRAFVREAELLANLSHPGVAKARDLFSDPGGQYLVMEYIPGSDLEQILSSRGGPVQPEVALEWMDQALDALSYMHARRPPVIHRDIKPSNLKLTPSGHVMLIDFGLAKGSGTTSLAGYSANFAPLEQLQGDGTDARSDLYALGATLYRMLTGRAPESALDRVKQIAKYQRDPLLSAHTVNGLVPEAVAQVVWEAMAIEPEDRLQSADEMRTRLREAGESLAPTYQWAYAPTLCDQIVEQNSKARSVPAGGKSTVPFTERLAKATSISKGPVGVVTPSQVSIRRSQPAPQYASVPTPSVGGGYAHQVAVEPSQAAPKSRVGKYLLASCCLVTLLFLGVAGNSYNNWRIEQAQAQQQELERRKDLQRQEESSKVAEQKPVEPSQLAQSLVALNQETPSQNQAEEQASLEIAKRRREAAAREAERVRQAAAVRETEKLRQEAAAREAEKLRQEAAAREAEKLRQEAAAREADRQRHEAAVRESERQRQEASARELEKQKAAWEAERQKAAKEAEKQKLAWEAERQKIARDAEKQRQENAAREAEIAKQREKAEAAARKAEKDAKVAKKQKKRYEEKEEKKDDERKVGNGVRVGVSILGGILNRRQNKP